MNFMNGRLVAFGTRFGRLVLCPAANVRSASKLASEMSVGFSAECTRKFSEDDIRQFSILSRDDNPLHLSKDYAQGTRFGSPIIHGILVVSMFSGLLYKDIGGEGSILVSIASQFTAPAYPEELLVARATVSDIKRRVVTLKLQCQAVERGETVIDGSATIMLPKAEK